ncbi:MAG TPA: LysM peptidoglycan-binding domain-containing protein, partial [Longimicrobiales bacterium]|nr:LysM peptidoglycan-binding domain-containing protein [Longimicrobiales bacterium]
LEDVLLGLERGGVLDATLERYPRHYHIALFPRQYAAYVDNIQTRETTRLGDRMAYTIQAGDSLWDIAREYGTTVDEIQAVNGIDGSRIYAGQVIDLPLGN